MVIMAKKIDELKGLPPEERIKKLKQIADEDKKEIEEAQRLLSSSEEEMDEEMKKYQDIPVPQMRAIDIGSLFSPEEKQMFAEKRPFEASIKKRSEEQAKEEDDVKKVEEQGFIDNIVEKESSQFQRMQTEQQQQYIHHLATATTANDIYHGIAGLGRAAHEQGYLSGEQQDRLASFYQAAREKEEAFQQGAYAANSTVAKQIEHTLDLFHELKKNYIQ